VSRETGIAEDFIRAQARTLHHYGVDAESRFIDVDAVGRAHVLVAGHGPPVMLVIGGGLPAAMWAPLMAELGGFTLHAVDLPGLGVTGPAAFSAITVRSFAVDFLDQVRAGLGLDRPVVVGQSIGGQWSTWMALDRPDQVPALALVACPAAMLGTSAPLPLRLVSVPGLGRLMTGLVPPSPAQIDRLARAAGEDFTGNPELRALLLAAHRLPTWSPSLITTVRSVVSIRGAPAGRPDTRRARPHRPTGAARVGRGRHVRTTGGRRASRRPDPRRGPPRGPGWARALVPPRPRRR
jgi:pimeloyl-ACP methyl ester carboxylesterase